MANLKKGDRVKVDFTNNPETIHAGIRFTGYGVVDRVEDGRVFGRLDDGQPLMCFVSDVEVFTERDQEVGDDSHIENHVSPLCKVEAIGMSDFEKYWEENASKDSWVNKAVAWNIWKEKQSKIDELQKRVDAALKLIPSLKSENDLWGCEQVERQIELLEQALKGDPDESN